MKREIILLAILLGVSAGGLEEVKAFDQKAVTQTNINEVVREESVEEWKFESIKTNISSPQEKNTNPIEIEAVVSGKSENLSYKFVWEKDNWKEWGIIQDFSDMSKTLWKPQDIGDYKIYVDVKDENGYIITKSINYTIKEVSWDNIQILTSPENQQKRGQNVLIKADVENIEGIQYKFVWQKNNWKEWGVISDFSEKKEVEYFFTESGNYKLYVDIKETDGTIHTKIVDYKIKKDLWRYEGIIVDKASPQEKYTAVSVSAKTSGETENLKYKFVWMKNNWKEWGVIKDYSEYNSVEWYPEETGEYFIYVDVCDSEGEIITKQIRYSIVPVYWSFNKVEISPGAEQKKNDLITIRADVNGNTEKLKYKYVWMKNNWKEWGIIKEFSENNFVEWNVPDEYGDYKIYVDVKDRDNKIVTKIIEGSVVSQIWNFDNISIANEQEEQVYTEIPIKVNMKGETDKLEYKYVWEKDDWSKWGVIQDFSESNTVIWYPKEAGTYRIYVDVKSKDGRKKTTYKEYTVNETSWKLENVKVEGNSAKHLGEKFEIDVLTSGEKEGLQYKFVWMKDDWKEWGILQNFSENNHISWTPSEEGMYYLYVDIKDKRGVVFDPYITKIGVYAFNGVKIADNVQYDKWTEVSADITGGAPGAVYKIVWQRDNWKKWGVLKDFSEAMSVRWKPDTYAKYTVYVDMKLEDGRIVTKTKEVSVRYPYSKITIDQLLGISGNQIVQEMQNHENDSFYLGTPFVGADLTYGTTDRCMHPNGSPGAGGYVGMNCTGFVAVVFQRCGANLNPISEMGRRAGYTNASNWFNYVKKMGAEYYQYYSIQELLSSKKAEKGDIIYCEPNWNLSGADCHIGLFWGDTPDTNTFWHQMEINKISHIYAGSPVIKYYLIKTRKG